MTSIFIFYKDSDYLSLLINQILNKTSNIRVIGFSKYINKESIKICNNLMPNIIIGSYSIIKNLQNFLNFKYISLKLETSNLQSIEIICHQLKMLSFDTKYSHKLNTNNLRKKIYNHLIDLKFNPNMVGTQYLLDCILCLHENPYSQLNHIEISKYHKKIAIKYQTNSQTINWNIQKSIENMHKNTTKNFRKTHYQTEEYLGYSSILNHFRFLY